MYNSVIFLFSSNTIYIIMTLIIFFVLFFANEIDLKKLRKSVSIRYSSDMKVKTVRRKGKKLPGPSKKFLIGNLDLLSGYETPFQAFGVLKETYGNVFSLQMGSVPAVVVNGYENIKEVLLTKGEKFDARPNFNRFNILFDGDKENSLAFCDWSDVQKNRREVLAQHTFPRSFSFNYNRFNKISLTYLQDLSATLKTKMDSEQNGFMVKPMISELCFRVFLEYFASRSFEKGDENLQVAGKCFDKIFWEVNQGRAYDFLPFLKPFYMKKLNEMQTLSGNIRHFMENDVIEGRFNEWKSGDEVGDYIDAMIDQVKSQQGNETDWNKALFAIEDIIGGHSAVANYVMKVLALLVKNPVAQKKIQCEIDSLLSSKLETEVCLNDRSEMIYTEAAMMESLRLIASPIVPHVASSDSSIDGYEIKEGTFIFLNNYELNMSSDFWSEPEKFDIERFISAEGRIVKPEYFIPFGFGRRSCMGYKIVNMLSFILVTNILKDYDISPCDKNEIKVEQCSLAVQDDTFKFKFQSRAQKACSVNK